MLTLSHDWVGESSVCLVPLSTSSQTPVPGLNHSGLTAIVPKLNKPIPATLGGSWGSLLAGTLFRGHQTIAVSAQWPQTHAGPCQGRAVRIRIQAEAQVCECPHCSQPPALPPTKDAPVGGLASRQMHDPDSMTATLTCASVPQSHAGPCGVLPKRSRTTTCSGEWPPAQPPQ